MKRTQIIGICNVTPDSFSDGGLYYEADRAVEHTLEMFDQGADIVDIGAESTRPGATPIDHVEEWRRLKLVIDKLGELGLLPKISVDTRRPDTVFRLLPREVGIINDVSGNLRIAQWVFRHNQEAKTLSRTRYVYSCLHERTIQDAHIYPYRGTYEDFRRFVGYSLWGAWDYGCDGPELIVDPLIGFGKSPELSEELLRLPEAFPKHDMMIGYSRKSFLEKRGLTNLDAGRIAIGAGAAYLRVHDVAEHVALRDELCGAEIAGPEIA